MTTRRTRYQFSRCDNKRHRLHLQLEALRLATVAVVVVSVLISPTAARGYTFGDWARDRGYNPGDAMLGEVDAQNRGIDGLDGIREFDWTTTPTTELSLWGNQLSSIEAGAFSGLTNLTWLGLYGNQLSSIEAGVFGGLTNLTDLRLFDNQLSSIEAGAFSGLANLTWLGLGGNADLIFRLASD